MLFLAAVLLGICAFAPTAEAGVCGNEILEDGEDCEAPFDACCDANTCTHQPTGLICRGGSDDGCDPDETCTGDRADCPEDSYSADDVVCRPGGAHPDGSGFSCDATEYCPGVPGGPCPPDLSHDLEDALVVRIQRDTKISRRHNSANYGAGGIIHLKRNRVRGLVGADLTCQSAASDQLDCALLEMTIHEAWAHTASGPEGGRVFRAHVMERDWIEGNGAFDDFSWNKGRLGPFHGTGSGTTWGCAADQNLAGVALTDCPGTDFQWLGGDVCTDGPCYEDATWNEALLLESDQEKLHWDMTSDLLGNPAPISWLLKVADETAASAECGNAKVYQREGVRLIAQWDDELSAREAFSFAPRLLLFGRNLQAPYAELIEPTHRLAAGQQVEVRVNQVGQGVGDEARWENETLGEWGYLAPSTPTHWAATIPLAAGDNQVTFTVYDDCGTEGHTTFTLTSTSEGDFCGDGVLSSGEECDDGNAVSGDCCSGNCLNEPDGASCPDHDACTPTSSCQAGTCVGSSPSPPNCGTPYLCYRSVVTPHTARFERVYDLPLVGDFVDTTAFLRIPQSLCLSGIDDQGSGAGIGTQWVGYAMKETSSSTRPSNVEMTDRFGTAEVRLGKAIGFLSPAGLALETTAMPLGTDEMDSMLCYRASIRRKGPAFNKIVSLADSMESRRYVIRKPSRLCVPVGSPEQPPTNVDAPLMCYTIGRAPGESAHERMTGKIHIADGFGSLQIDTRRESEFCVSATIHSQD